MQTSWRSSICAVDWITNCPFSPSLWQCDDIVLFEKRKVPINRQRLSKTLRGDRKWLGHTDVFIISTWSSTSQSPDSFGRCMRTWVSARKYRSLTGAQQQNGTILRPVSYSVVLPDNLSGVVCRSFDMLQPKEVAYGFEELTQKLCALDFLPLVGYPVWHSLMAVQYGGDMHHVWFWVSSCLCEFEISIDHDHHELVAVCRFRQQS